MTRVTIWLKEKNSFNITLVMEDSELDLFETPRAKSQVWEHFWLRKRNGIVLEGVAVCKQCHLDIKTAGGTTSLAANHLRQHHPVQMVGAVASHSSQLSPGLLLILRSTL